MSEKTAASVQLGDSVIFQALQDEIVILNMEKQEYYGLDSVGADAWQLLLEHKDVSEVVRRLKLMYDVDEQTASGDIEALVTELMNAGLLKEANEGTEQSSAG